MCIRDRLYAEGALTSPQTLWTRTRRPVHELYDTTKYPHELRNLAYSPTHKDEHLRMQQALDSWIAMSGDWDFRSELDMVESMWPNGEQPITGANNHAAASYPAHSDPDWRSGSHTKRGDF